MKKTQGLVAGIPHSYIPVCSALFKIGFSPAMLEEAVFELMELGSAQNATTIPETHRDEVEALLPEVTDPEWSRWDGVGLWEPTDV